MRIKNIAGTSTVKSIESSTNSSSIVSEADAEYIIVI